MTVAITKQTDRQIVVAMKEQPTIGTLVSGASGEKIRFSQSPGPTKQYAQVPSTESRNDGLARAPGRGRVTVPATFNSPAAAGAFDTIDKSVMRSTWTASATVDQTMTGSSVTATIGISAGVVTASAGSFITAGLRPGMAVYSDAGFHANDQNVWMGIVALTATTCTLVRFDGVALTDVAGPVATWTIKTARNTIQGTTDYAYTLEVYRSLTDKSEAVDFFRWGSFTRSVSPDQEVQRSFTGLGRNMTILGTSAAPSLTSPTVTTTDALQSAQTKLILGTSAVVGLSAFNISLNINVFRDQSVDELTNEIGVGQPVIQAAITVLEDDLTTVQTFLDGTDTSAIIATLGTETTGLKTIEAVSFTKMKFLTATPSPMGQDQFSTREYQLLVDADLRGGAFDATMLRLSTSAA